MLDLYQFGYGSILLEKLNRFHEDIAGTMPNGSIEQYRLYMYMGALFNTAIMWLQNGKKEDVGDIARMFCTACGITGFPVPYFVGLSGNDFLAASLILLQKQNLKMHFTFIFPRKHVPSHYPIKTNKHSIYGLCGQDKTTWTG